jgi:hypothetical protein
MESGCGALLTQIDNREDTQDDEQCSRKVAGGQDCVAKKMCQDQVEKEPGRTYGRDPDQQMIS